MASAWRKSNLGRSGRWLSGTAIRLHREWVEISARDEGQEPGLPGCQARGGRRAGDLIPGDWGAGRAALPGAHSLRAVRAGCAHNTPSLGRPCTYVIARSSFWGGRWLWRGIRGSNTLVFRSGSWRCPSTATAPERHVVLLACLRENLGGWFRTSGCARAWDITSRRCRSTFCRRFLGDICLSIPRDRP